MHTPYRQHALVSPLTSASSSRFPSLLKTHTQRCVADQGFSISSDALGAYLTWMSANHDTEMAKGNYLPDIAYDVESKLFSFM